MTAALRADRVKILFFIAIAIISMLALAWHAFSDGVHVETGSVYSLALAVYLCSHVFRMIRLTALAADDPQAVYLAAPAHLISAPLGFMVPFKLGEIFRLIILVAAFEKPKKALFVWFLERLGDALVLVAVAALLLVIGRSSAFDAGNLVLGFAGIGVMLLLSFWAVFDLSSFLIDILVLRSRSKAGFFILRQLAEFRAVAVNLSESMRGRLLTLFVTSMFIWLCELYAFLILSGASHEGGQNLSQVLSRILLPDRGVTAAYAQIAASAQLVLFLTGSILAATFIQKFKSQIKQDA